MSEPSVNRCDEHGIVYRSRDGIRGWDLVRFLERHPEPSELPRPERDVLRALLKFCLEGLDHLDAVEQYGLIAQTAVATDFGGSGAGR